MGEKVQVTGYVRRIFEKKGESSQGPWTAYSIKVMSPEGEEDPRFYQFGFTAPPFKADAFADGKYSHTGDYISFEAEIKDEKAAKYIEGTGKILKNGPARKEPEKKGGGGRGGKGGGGPKVTKSALFGDIGGYNTEDDIRRITLTASRTAALEAVGLLLQYDALPMTKSKGKAHDATRFDEVTAMIDKLTVQYFFDNATGRLLTEVEDRSPVKEAAPLPPDTAEEKNAEEQEHDTEWGTDDEEPAGQDEEAEVTF